MTWQKAAVGMTLITFIAGLLLAPAASIVALIYIATSVIGLNGLLWLFACLYGRFDTHGLTRTGDAPLISDHRPPPCVSILIALYREAEVAPLLMKRYAYWTIRLNCWT